MLIEGVEGELIYVYASVYELEETACCAYVFYYEMTYAQDYLAVVRRQNLLYRCFAQQIGNKV